MGDTLIIGGQPDYLGNVVTTWTKHGREIATGDAEKVLDLAPSVRHRAPSIGSGEHYYMKDWNEEVQSVSSPKRFARGILNIVSNLQDVEAKTRVIIQPHTGGGVANVFPATVTDEVNITAPAVSDIDQDPYGAITTWATPDDPSLDWSVAYHFTNASTLQTSVADSQILLVLLRFKGTYAPGDATQTAGLTIVDEDNPLHTVTKPIRARLSDGDTMLVSIPFDPNDFVDPTCTSMAFAFTGEGAASGGSGNLYWELGSVCWVRILTGNTFDSGWRDVESGPAYSMSTPTPHTRVVDRFYMSSDTAVHSSHPYLSSQGFVQNTDERYTHVFFTFREDSSSSTGGAARIFGSSANYTPSGWRPEIGLVAEGPADGSHVEFNPQVTSVDPSIIRMSKGGNDWVIRREPRRRLSLSASHISAADFATELFSVMRRAGVSRPFCVAFKPGSDYNAAVSAAVSMYGKLIAFDATNFGTGDRDGAWRVSMTFEEVV